MAHVFIVEDEVSIALAVKAFLEKEGFICTVRHTAAELLDLVEQYQPDLIVLDVMLPGGDGVELCKQIRERMQIPIVMLTAKSTEKDRLEGLQAGADDYVCKPFSAPELVLRIRAILRRVNGEKRNNASGLILNDNNLTVSYKETTISLTVVEFSLLKALSQNPDVIVSRDALMDVIYDDQRVVSDRTVDSHVSKLKRKLRQLPTENELVSSVYGAGYKFSTPIKQEC
jgi:two-component system response regulator BaeR